MHVEMYIINGVALEDQRKGLPNASVKKAKPRDNFQHFQLRRTRTTKRIMIYMENSPL